MQNTPQVAPANEILSAFLSHDVGADTDALKSDATGFIAKKYGTDLSAYDVHIVENTPATCHLTLPYYEVVDAMGAARISDSNVGEVSGSEIATLLAAIAIFGIASAGGVVAVGMIAAEYTGNIPGPNQRDK